MSAIELNFMLDALRVYSENVTLLSNENPYRLSLNGQLYSIHTGLIHDSGNRRTNSDESRIQLSSANRKIQLERRSEHTIVFIGFFSRSNSPHADNIATADGAVFSAWNPEYVISKNDKETGALYGRFSHEGKVLALGGAVHRFRSTILKRDISTISMRVEDLGFYLENIHILHVATSDLELQNAINSLEAVLSLPDPGVEAAPEITIGGHKEKVTVTRTAYPRDPKFSRDVLAAYGHACAICGKQLGLVQAAHIIPHNQHDCPNHVTNGIALCTEHHKLYDDVLLLPRPDGTLYINPTRVEHLENIGQGEGLADIEKLALKPLKLPNDAAHKPNPDYLQRGFNIRLGLGD